MDCRIQFYRSDGVNLLLNLLGSGAGGYKKYEIMDPGSWIMDRGYRGINVSTGLEFEDAEDFIGWEFADTEGINEIIFADDSFAVHLVVKKFQHEDAFFDVEIHGVFEPD
ncbi:unannotated protein [freshwater metagenome]|uniref:Unannotated protein n=1 Tax=freshwater metagenome TaxID=449393 RepID=A0A6J6EZ07_9ZZZZ